MLFYDELANGAVAGYLSNGMNKEGKTQFLSLEKAAIVLDGMKLTTDVGTEVRYQLGKEEAKCFYTAPKRVIHGVNRRGF
jgi:hypothetical protein